MIATRLSFRAATSTSTLIWSRPHSSSAPPPTPLTSSTSTSASKSKRDLTDISEGKTGFRNRKTLYNKWYFMTRDSEVNWIWGPPIHEYLWLEGALGLDVDDLKIKSFFSRSWSRRLHRRSCAPRCHLENVWGSSQTRSRRERSTSTSTLAQNRNSCREKLFKNQGTDERT